MKTRHRRWTVLVVAIWVLTLGLTTVLAPNPADAKITLEGWMVYSPNHPNACAPLPYDCYVIWVEPN